MNQKFDNNNNNSATQNPYNNAYSNNGAPNQYANNGVPNQNNNYNNTGMPNQYGNNSVPNQNNMGMPNQYANNSMPNQNNYNNAGVQNQYNNAMPNQYNAGASQWQSPNKNKKSTALIVLIAVVPVIIALGFIGAIAGIVFGVFNKVKESEEYAIAYSYVVNSETFERLEAEESDIKLTGYKSAAAYSIGGDSHSDKEEFTFKVEGRTLIVVCHKESSGESYVCEECTWFD